MNNKNKIILISSIALVILVGIVLFSTSSNKETNIKTYKVTFDSGNGEVIEQIVNEGETVQIPEEPTKEGYVFVGWMHNGYIFDFSKVINNDITLEAEWKEVKKEVENFVVKFDTDGGTTIANQVLEKGEQVSKPTTPIKEGHIFKYWMLNDKEYDFNKEVTENITLKASWMKIITTENNNQNNNTGNNNATNKEENKMAAPVLSNAYERPVGFENGKYIYDLTVNTLDYCNIANDTCSVVGFEIYEKTGAEYKYVASGTMGGAAVVEVEAGTKKTYVARVYQYNASNKKIYSGYSNEVVLDNMTYATPILRNMGSGTGATEYVGFENGKYIYDLTVNTLDYCNIANDTCSVVGFEIYEKIGTEYKYVASATMGGAAVVEVEAGTKKTLVARVYQYNASNKKIYSGYSNEVVLDNMTYAAPILRNMGSGTGATEYVGFENGKYIYDLTVNTLDYCNIANDTCSVVGFEIYEKIGTEYKYVASATMGGAAVVEVEAGTKKTYVARVYQYNASNKKVYSGYSNEVVLDNMTYATPILRNMGSGTGLTEYVGFENGKYIYDLTVNTLDYCNIVNDTCSVVGFEIYEKIGTEYKYVASATMGGAAVVEVETGTKKTYVSRVYQYNASNKKIYSGYSNELVITAPTNN